MKRLWGLLTGGMILALIVVHAQTVGPSPGGSGGSVATINTTTPVTGGPITTTGTIACATCVTSAAALSNNLFMMGSGAQASQTVSAVTATAALNLFSSTLQGLAPLSGGGTTTFLRADGTWAAPAGSGGTVTSVATTGPITGGTFTTTGTIACATCGVTGSPLSQFASTTSAQLAGTISDETGTGLAVFGTSPALLGVPTAPNPASNTNSTQVATTSFTQGLIASLNQAVSVQAATVTVLPNTPTYSNGTAGVGATLTAGSVGALTIDGYTVLLNDRVLVNNQAAALQNGVYTVSTLGTGGVAYILTRAVDFNTPARINNSGAIPVLNGTANNNTLWVLNISITTIGTDAINYNLGATTPFPALTITNAASTGTTLNKLVKLTGAPSTVVISAISDTNGAVGICAAGCGTTAAATILESGVGTCIFDGATTAGNYVQISASVAGDCHDGGASFPASGEVIGRVMTTNAAGGSFSVLLFSPDVVVQAAAIPHSVTFSINGNGSTISTGNLLTNWETETAGTIYKVVSTGTATAGPANCSITVDVWKAANAIPTSGGKISASAPATLSTAQLSTDTTLTGWTTAVAVGDVFGATVASVTGCVTATVQVWWR